jgi:RNA polymerase subunit RPABC4/transcription elongation factor Spt4
MTAAAIIDGNRACARCETVNDPDAEFCKKCGAKLIVAS